ncbi:RHS repeat-associated core domain-containing protein [Fibrobacter sp. UWH9]|uniref:RHS repeat domain-containing protein n=1 Tax=Fibrobacter sp. UWH9 TaxID=1896213 RepID=UPI00092468D0|nr:RHS repeat-associated core domain-containing protein [Fibrobacter sp. UWH9]SHH92676.1 RHS repeat-associated core domain-containing protein [Fibrobacter sp. UWH9]
MDLSEIKNNLVYDSEGNLIEDKSKNLKISYDWRGMPVEFRMETMADEVHQPTRGCSRDSVRLLMAYDGSGRRVSKTRERKACISETSSGAIFERTYAADWERELVTHYTGIGTEVRESFHNGTPSETKVVVNMPNGLGRYMPEDASAPVVPSTTLDENGKPTDWSVFNPKFEWYLKNHLGSTMLVYGTGDGAGSVKAAYDYRAFGEQVSLMEPAEKVTENFTGKELDDETELNYFGARYLDPMIGMWTSVDAARQHFSPYTYGSNNPLNVFDPDGNEDVYFMLANTKEKGRNLISMSQFKKATAVAAEAFKSKGYSVKYAQMNKNSFNEAVNDPQIKKLYAIGHVNKGDGTILSTSSKEKWMSADDIANNDNLDFTVAGCRSQGLIEKQWGDNFNSSTGLNSSPVMSSDALVDLDRAAQVDAMFMQDLTEISEE